MDYSELNDATEDLNQHAIYGGRQSGLYQGQDITSQAQGEIYRRSNAMEDPRSGVEYQEAASTGAHEDYSYHHAETSTQGDLVGTPVEQQYEYEGQGSTIVEDPLDPLVLTPEPVLFSNQVHVQPNHNFPANTVPYMPGVQGYLEGEIRHDPWTPLHLGSNQWAIPYGQYQSQTVQVGQENQATYHSSMPNIPPQDATLSDFGMNGPQIDTYPPLDNPGNITWTDSVPIRDPLVPVEYTTFHPRPPENMVYGNVPENRQDIAAFAPSGFHGLDAHYNTAPAATQYLVGNQIRPSLELTGYVNSRSNNIQVTDSELTPVSYGQTDARLPSPNGFAGQGSSSTHEISPSKKKVKSRRSKALPIRPLLTGDNTPSEDTSSIVSPFQTLDTDMKPTTPRRIRRLSAGGRIHAKKMRKRGCCDECRRKKCKV